MTDPISDLLVRIKNAQKSGREIIEMPFSKAKLAVAQILTREGLLGGVEKKGAKGKEKMEIKLKYIDNGPAIQDLRRISRPGQRIYTMAGKIRAVKQGYGIAVISTSQGLMTDKEAKKKRMGGEILCEVW